MSKTIVRYIFPIVLAATVAVALFGFMVMSESGHVMAGCSGITSGVACSMLGAIEHFQSHLNTFQSISMGVVKIFALFASLLFAVALHFLRPRGKPDSVIKESSTEDRSDTLFLSYAPFVHWLALHEKRDASLSCAMNM